VTNELGRAFLSWGYSSTRAQFWEGCDILAIQPLKDETKGIWVTEGKIDDRVHPNILGLGNEKFLVDLEALAFGSNPEFDDFRTSVTIEESELANSIYMGQSYS
jgi:hypothetical protein